MKKRIIIPTLLSAALFTACVKDTESDSVKNYRDAQTENVKAEAALSKAKAETEKQEMAIKAQEAEHKKQLVEFQKQQNAIEAQKLETQKELDKVNLEIAKAKSEAEKVALEKEKVLLEQQQAQVKLETADLELKIEKAKLDAEQQKLQSELALAQEKINAKNQEARDKSIAEVNYASAVERLRNLNGWLSAAELDLVSLKNDADAQKIANGQITSLKNQIAVLEAKKTALTTANRDVQTLKVNIAKKEAEVVEKNIAYQEAMDNYSKERGKYPGNEFRQEFSAVEGSTLVLGDHFYSIPPYGENRYLGFFIKQIGYSYAATMREIIFHSTSKELTQDGFVYSYNALTLLESKNLTEIEREIVYRKQEVANYKAVLNNRTTDLANATKATATAKKAWETATGADKDVKFQEYGLKFEEQKQAQANFDEAKRVYESVTSTVERFEKVLALLNNLAPFNAVVTKYNTYLEGLSKPYFAMKKAEQAYNTASTELQALNATLTALTTGNIEQAINGLNTEIAGLNEEIVRLEKVLGDKQALVKAREEAIASLKVRVEAQKKVVEAYRAQL